MMWRSAKGRNCSFANAYNRPTADTRGWVRFGAKVYGTVPVAMHKKTALFKSTGVAIATFVGGSFATTYLVRKNLLDTGRPEEARKATVIFGSIGAAFLVVASRTPPDLISSLLIVGIPQFLLVLAVLRLTRFGDFSGHVFSGAAVRSNWQAFVVGVTVNLLLKASFYCTSLLLI